MICGEIHWRPRGSTDPSNRMKSLEKPMETMETSVKAMEESAKSIKFFKTMNNMERHHGNIDENPRKLDETHGKHDKPINKSLKSMEPSSAICLSSPVWAVISQFCLAVDVHFSFLVPPNPSFYWSTKCW